jgi:hypothetical protein
MNSRGGIFAERFEQGETVEAGVVTIVPGRLPRVATDQTEAPEMEALRTVADVGPMNVAHDVGLAAATRAGAGAAELFQLDVTLLSIAPADGEFTADDIRAEELEGHEEILDRRNMKNKRESSKSTVFHPVNLVNPV